MNLRYLLAAPIAALMMINSTQAAVATITALDVRSGGIFGHDDNVGVAPQSGNLTINGADADGSVIVADPLDIRFTYDLLDLDGDSTANDSVTFTLRAEKIGEEGGNLRTFNQGFDTGFGNLNDLQVSVVNVTGTTTDAGDFIVFDGFIGAAVGFGGNGDLDSSATINGDSVSVISPSTGSFQFLIEALDFEPTPTVTFDDSVRNGIGTIVARHYDLQFSTTDVDPGVDGDFDGDLDVDGADFLGYQINDPSEIPTWEANYGNGTAVPSIAGVPEPSSLLLCVLGGVAGMSATRRRSY